MKGEKGGGDFSDTVEAVIFVSVTYASSETSTTSVATSELVADSDPVSVVAVPATPSKEPRIMDSHAPLLPHTEWEPDRSLSHQTDLMYPS